MNINQLPFLVFFLLLPALSFGQEEESPKGEITIEKIIFEGNKHTKEFVILRELSFKEGDILYATDTADFFVTEEKRVYNLSLFHKVDIYASNIEASKVTITISVSERSRLIDSRVVLEVGDRNFNEWWNNRNRDLKRLNMGGKFKNNNFRGRKEILSITAEVGFTRKFALNYKMPYIDKNYNSGLNFSFAYGQTRSVAYKNSDLDEDLGEIIYNRQGFVDAENIISENYLGAIEYTKRVGLFTNHLLGVSFYNNQISDTVFQLNPNYYANNQKNQNHFEFRYSYSYDTRDFSFYPLKGHKIHAEFTKRGLGIFNDLNQWEVKADYSKFFTLKRNFFAAFGVFSKLTFPKNQGYFNTKGLGYGFDFVRGHDLHVINGEHYFLTKASFKKQLLAQFKAVKMKWMPNLLKDLRYIPFGIYLKTFVDNGYNVDINPTVHNDLLANRLLTGYGVGVDLTTFFDLVTSLEYSINTLGERNLFIRFSAGIK